MRYQKIETKIWDDEKFIGLSEKAKLLFLYLLTCPHSNAIGVYVLKLGYIAEDLNWPIAKGFETLSELLRVGLARYDKKVSVVCLPSFLKYNPIENPNQFVNANKIINYIPKTQIFESLIPELQALSEHFKRPFRNPFETLSKPETETETETETEAETDKSSCQPMADPANGLDIQTLAKLWNETAPTLLSRVNLPLKRKPKELQIIKSAISRNQDLSWWQNLFKLLPGRPFLLGQNDRGWKASFDFVVDKAELIADGKYADLKTSKAASGPMEWLASRRQPNETPG
jgi:hypothetical protein